MNATAELGTPPVRDDAIGDPSHCADCAIQSIRRA
jgi:hypothetical protein